MDTIQELVTKLDPTIFSITAGIVSGIIGMLLLMKSTSTITNIAKYLFEQGIARAFILFIIVLSTSIVLNVHVSRTSEGEFPLLLIPVFITSYALCICLLVRAIIIATLAEDDSSISLW